VHIMDSLVGESDSIFKQIYLLLILTKAQYLRMTKMDLGPYGVVSLFARSLFQGIKATWKQGQPPLYFCSPFVLM
jgi:hypothetical protein